MAHILLLEDDQALASIFAKWLASAGHEVELVEDGAKGIRAVTLHRRPDLLITDLMMPEMGGEDFAAAMSMLMPEKPLLVVTACADAEKIARVAAAPNVVKVLAKPISNGQLLKEVENAL